MQSYDLSYNNPPTWAMLQLISQALRSLVTLFQTNKTHLKFQLEWFIQWCMSSIDSGLVAWDIGDWMQPTHDPSTTIKERVTSFKRTEILVGEVREMILQSLFQLTTDPSFFSTLYVNYDGDMNTRTYLYEDFMMFLSKVRLL